MSREAPCSLQHPARAAPAISSPRPKVSGGRIDGGRHKIARPCASAKSREDFACEIGVLAHRPCGDCLLPDRLPSNFWRCGLHSVGDLGRQAQQTCRGVGHIGVDRVDRRDSLARIDTECELRSRDSACRRPDDRIGLAQINPMIQEAGGCFPFPFGLMPLPRSPVCQTRSRCANGLIYSILDARWATGLASIPLWI
jgi:hypothetical protein